MELYLKNWYNKFIEELLNTKKLRIVSPFVNEQILRKVHGKFDYNNFELITRYNLQDFAIGASSLSGLKFAVEKGANVYGIKELHSKIYLFDERAAIVTSANLTHGGLIGNHECGVFLTEPKQIAILHNYFEQLKSMASGALTIDDCLRWDDILSGIKIPRNEVGYLEDYGASAIISNNTRSYYIKFFGKADNRVGLDFMITDEIDRALCHYACGFSLKKKPKQVNEGDVIFMARMTGNPYDYAIFGRAIALKYTEGRDIASEREILERPWKNKWPIYLRVQTPVFIDGIMANGILLSDLITEFDYDSFASTRRRFDKGERDIKPIKSLMQKAYVKLTHNSADWLENKFDRAITNFGKVDESFIQSLPTSVITPS